MNNPVVIQGGMGVGVSGWRLANAVSRTGQLGVVSGTALDQVFARRLQDGDVGGHMRRALDHFPFREMAERFWRDFFISGGKKANAAYLKLPMMDELFIVANFVEVFLAKEGHGHAVGINYLEKIQIPHLPSIYGAMLAGVDYVLMGAGIPLKIPGVLDRFANHETATYPLQVTGGEDGMLTFTPIGTGQPLKRPRFLAIVASHVLAATLLKKANGRVDGFIVEGPTAGGHNAPPRGKQTSYGERDVVDLAKMRELGAPFWLAGGYGSAEKLSEALAKSAAGVQVGTPFAFCDESGLREDYKRSVLCGSAPVETDFLASPTGFPFKVVQLEGTISEEAIYRARPRVCDLGYLREAYRTAEGSIGYRCPGEPVTVYVAKGGKAEATEGRKCLCNALLANIGHPQVRAGKHVEPGLMTAGDDLASVMRFGLNYTASDVVASIYPAQ